MRLDLNPQRLVAAYAAGVFPMADEAGIVHWLAPDPRAIIELDSFRISRSLRGVVRRGAFHVTINRAFDEVIEACANRPEGTWISVEIMNSYRALHRLRIAHSVETWMDGALTGGLYGLALGGAFFGESMFHRVTDASKVAMVSLVDRLRRRGFVLLDVQFVTDHLKRFGAREIPRTEYERRLGHALRRRVSFAEGTEPSALNPRGSDTG